jgi:Ca-activated chloride channel family protein
VVVVTDAQVSDSGRILALVEREAGRPERRRVDVLCIDAAPNSGLANELAERGGGLARFLTSDPAENDIASALDEVLADWAAPILRNLTLQVNGEGVQAAGRRVSTANGSGAGGAAIDLGDLSVGRAVWVAGRVRRDAAGRSEAVPSFRLLADGREVGAVPADPEAGRTSHPSIAALFGARRVLDLELAQSSGAEPIERLRQLGYEPSEVLGQTTSGTDAPIYAENARAQATAALHNLLVNESLRYGIACSATAFVATRREAGQRVAGTVAVANALAHGWSGDFLSGGTVMMARMAMPAPTAAMPAPYAPMPFAGPPLGAPPPAPGVGGGRGGFAQRLRRGLFGSGDSAPNDAASRASVPTGAPSTGSGGGLTVLFSGTPRVVQGEAVLFDSGADSARLTDGGTLSRLVVRFLGASPASLDAGLTLALYVDDLTAPRARVRLADLLRQGGERPLHIRHQPGQALRLVLLDPAGAWASGGPEIEVSLG